MALQLQTSLAQLQEITSQLRGPEPMTHQADFLQDILAQPKVDGPRLRYAQWLDERCDSLGEFIRVQCRLETIAPDHPAALELERRQRELLAEFEMDWVGELAQLVEYWVFHRGFVEEVGLTTAKFLDHADRLFELAPIQQVHLGKVRDNLDSLTTFRMLERPSYLDLSSNPVRDQGAKLLAGCPYLAHLQGLNLSSSGIGDSGLRALANSPFLGQLRELYLCDNRIGDAGVRHLANSNLVRQLDALHLRFNAIGDDGAQVLQQRLGSRVVL